MSQQDLQQGIATLINQITQLLQAIQTLCARASVTPPVTATTPQSCDICPLSSNYQSWQIDWFFTHTGKALYDTGRTKLMDDESDKVDLKVTYVVRF